MATDKEYQALIDSLSGECERLHKENEELRALLPCKGQKMTREEAIKELQESLDTLREYDIAHSSRLKQALEMAIQALSQEPTDENLHREREQAYMQGYEDASKRFRQEPCDECKYKTFTELYFHTDSEMVEQEPTKRELGRDCLLQTFVEALKVLQAENDDLKEKLKQKSCDDCCYEPNSPLCEMYRKAICEKKDERQSGKCKNCKYFEYDSVAKVDGIPLIVAHEICNKWGDGCKTKEDGYCYLFEPQESEDKE